MNYTENDDDEASSLLEPQSAGSSTDSLPEAAERGTETNGTLF
jgi:hypothetical protein